MSHDGDDHDPARRFNVAKFEPANPGYRVPKAELVDPITMQDRPVPDRRWIVHGWMPHGSVTLLAGDGGVGKSLLSQQLLTCVATGRDWLGLPTTPCRALGIFCEDDRDELQRRQDAINRNLGLDFGDLENVNWMVRVGDDNLLMKFDGWDKPGEATEFYQVVHNAAQDFGAQVVLIDALHDAFGGNENARPQARQFINLLRSLARDIDGAVLLTSHPSLSGRNSGTGEAGSTAWSNTVRSRLYMSWPKSEEGNPEDQNARILSRRKANYSGLGDAVKLVWRDGAFCSPESATGMVGAIERGVAEKVFVDLLAAIHTEGRTVSDNRHSGSYAPRLFAKRPNRQGFVKLDFERAMESLFSQGKIKIGLYGDRPSRQFNHIILNQE